MAERIPLVMVGGQISQLPSADTLSTSLAGVPGGGLTLTYDFESGAQTGADNESISFGSANWTSTTRLFVSYFAKEGTVTSLLQNSAATGIVGGHVRIVHATDNTRFWTAHVNSEGQAGAGTEWRYDIDNSSIVTGGTQFANDDPLIFFFTPAGEPGAGSGVSLDLIAEITTDTTPNNGEVSWNTANHADAGAVTLYVSGTDTNGNTGLDTILQNAAVATTGIIGHIRLTSIEQPGVWFQYEVTAIAAGIGTVTDITVQNGSIHGTFADGEKLTLGFTPVGTAGAAGVAGADGVGAPIALTNANAGTINIAQAVYSSATGSVDLARADAAGTRKVIGLVSDATIATAVSGNVQTDGNLTATTGEWDAVTGQTGGLTTGSCYYLDASTAGSLTTTAPSTVGQFVVPVGKALSTTIMKLIDQPTIAL